MVNQNGDRRRSRYDIVKEILENAKNGKKKTQIKQSCGLSYDQLKKYIPLLIKNGFLKEIAVNQRNNSYKVLRTTERGFEYCNHMKDFSRGTI